MVNKSSWKTRREIPSNSSRLRESEAPAVRVCVRKLMRRLGALIRPPGRRHVSVWADVSGTSDTQDQRQGLRSSRTHPAREQAQPGLYDQLDSHPGRQGGDPCRLRGHGRGGPTHCGRGAPNHGQASHARFRNGQSEGEIRKSPDLSIWDKLERSYAIGRNINRAYLEIEADSLDK